MPVPDPNKTIAFVTPNDLTRWLQENHASETELWVKIFKKSSGKPSVTWNEVVIESLCWGWIDGIKKSLDEEAYLQRITPRKPRSVWSKRNRSHVERLIQENRMTEHGLVHVRAAQADGRWDNAYAISELAVPDDFLNALSANPKANDFYNTLSKSSRDAIAYGLTSAKRESTRERRFQKFMDMLVDHQKPGFGFSPSKK